MLVLFVAVVLVAPEGEITALAALAAGGLHLVRLARWRGHAVAAEPLLWVLHVAYGWLAAGLVMYGIAALGLGMTIGTALHALTVGAFGTMILAMVSRASLGHTGRPLTAGPGTAACYVLVSIAALARTAAPYAAPFADNAETAVLWLAAIAWTAAFGLFAILYFPVWTGPRVD